MLSFLFAVDYLDAVKRECISQLEAQPLQPWADGCCKTYVDHNRSAVIREHHILDRGASRDECARARLVRARKQTVAHARSRGKRGDRELRPVGEADRRQLKRILYLRQYRFQLDFQGKLPHSAA